MIKKVKNTVVKWRFYKKAGDYLITWCSFSIIQLLLSGAFGWQSTAAGPDAPDVKTHSRSNPGDTGRTQQKAEWKFYSHFSF